MRACAAQLSFLDSHTRTSLGRVAEVGMASLMSAFGRCGEVASESGPQESSLLGSCVNPVYAGVSLCLHWSRAPAGELHLGQVRNQATPERLTSV